MRRAIINKRIKDQFLERIVYKDQSTIHGNGLFARVSFKKDEYIGTYHGSKTTENNTYVLWVYDEDNEEKAVGVDGENLLRYLNHSEQPNTVFDELDLYAERDIEAGEELCFDYGETPD